MAARKTSRSVKPAKKASKSKASTRKPAASRKANGARGTGKAPTISTRTKPGSTAPEPVMRTVTGQLVVNDASAALAWYAKVFGAKELTRMPGPGGKIMHSTMRLGDTDFMVSDSFGQAPAQMNGAFLHIHDKGIQKMWDRAVASGAKVSLPLAPQFWGDSYGQLYDPFGQLWSFGWPANLTEAQKAKLQKEAMQQMEARMPA